MTFKYYIRYNKINLVKSPIKKVGNINHLPRQIINKNHINKQCYFYLCRLNINDYGYNIIFCVALKEAISSFINIIIIFHYSFYIVEVEAYAYMFIAFTQMCVQLKYN